MLNVFGLKISSSEGIREGLGLKAQWYIKHLIEHIENGDSANA